MEKAILCWSGGKDSTLALRETRRSRRYEIAALLTTTTQDYDRVSMHGVRRTLIEQQAESIGLPLEAVFISRTSSNEEYEARMLAALTRFKDMGVSAVIFGDIFLEELRRYRESNLGQLGLTAVFPLWRRDTAELARSFIEAGFKAITTCVDSRALDKSFVGRAFDNGFLNQLPSHIDPCGENGEFHSFTFAGPIFRHRIDFSPGEKVLRDSFYFCDLLPAETQGVN